MVDSLFGAPFLLVNRVHWSNALRFGFLLLRLRVSESSFWLCFCSSHASIGTWKSLRLLLDSFNSFFARLFLGRLGVLDRLEVVLLELNYVRRRSYVNWSSTCGCGNCFLLERLDNAFILSLLHNHGGTLICCPQETLFFLFLFLLFSHFDQITDLDSLLAHAIRRAELLLIFASNFSPSTSQSLHVRCLCFKAE